MAIEMNELSHEFIIHPGETIKELLDERDMSQKELAIRTDVSQAHISKIINGKIAISVGFAKRLEYAVGTPARFWINLQTNYDKELADYQELNQISQEEILIAQKLASIIASEKDLRLMDTQVQDSLLVVALRRFLNVSNLLRIPDMVQFKKSALASLSSVDPYVRFVQLRIDEVTANE